MLIHDACEIVSLSDPGCVRSVNEDVLSWVPEMGLVMVADGMGGHSGGGRAARIAVETIERRIRTALSGPDAAAVQIDASLGDAVAEADREIRRLAASDRSLSDMGATIACLLLRDNEACISHVGDTRVYRLRAGKLALLTRDHAINRYKHEAGVSEAAESGASHNRHFVTSALGVGHECAIETQRIGVEIGDVFLVCSDGLNDMIDGSDIELVLDTMQANLPLAARQLVMIARDCGGFDNVTVALLRVNAEFGHESAVSGGGVSLFARMRGWFGRRR